MLFSNHRGQYRGALDATRVKNTTHASHSAQRQPLQECVKPVSKPNNSLSEKDVKGGSFASDVAGQLDEYVETLQQKFETDIEIAREEALADLESLVSGFEETCAVFEKAEQPLQTGLAQEYFQHIDATDGVTQKEVSVGDCMEAYRGRIKQDHARLAQLWDQWSKIQYEIVCLAVEVFGKEVVEIGPGDVPDMVLEAIDQAHLVHEASCKTKEGVAARFSALEADLDALSTNSIEESKQQLKEISITRKKANDELAKAVQNFVNF